MTFGKTAFELLMERQRERCKMKLKPDPDNHDCTDFPTKGCRNCGRKDRPQWDGWCNDDSCSRDKETK